MGTSGDQHGAVSVNTKGVQKLFSVLFVCTANQIRSPAAEGIFKVVLASRGQNLELWNVGSAGTWTIEGNPAFKEVIELLKPEGIDLTSHRSRLVEQTMLNEFNLVLTMEPGHKEALQIVFPDRRADIYLLSEMAGLTVPVDDPVNGPIDGYIAAIKEIRELIEAGFFRIMELAQVRKNNQS